MIKNDKLSIFREGINKSIGFMDIVAKDPIEAEFDNYINKAANAQSEAITFKVQTKTATYLTTITVYDDGSWTTYTTDMIGVEVTPGYTNNPGDQMLR